MVLILVYMAELEEDTVTVEGELQQNFVRITISSFCPDAKHLSSSNIKLLSTTFIKL